MAKRRSTHHGSSSDSDSPAAKRSKLGDATNAPSTQPPRAQKQKQRAAAEDEEEAAADSGEDLSEGGGDEDDELLEVRIQAAVRAKLDGQKDKTGKIAEYGVIETLYMTNFMCHARLGFGFGPQMNFIIGHNGSGKSAALSALTIALGGKTNSTGRGNGLKAFIKEGQTQATVKVGIKNCGSDAFRADVYGPRIYIERRFTRDGSSSYRITSAEGRLVSTKRSELNAICDHMNIQVDNPLNILTQDAARQFLSASNARDKYSFFIKGTQLEPLMQSYDVMQDKIESMMRGHDTRREGLADLREKRDRATQRFEQANRAREMKLERDALGGELAWAFVAEKRQELEEAIKPVKKARKKLEQVEEAHRTALAELEAATAAVQEMQETLPEVSQEDRDELRGLNGQMREKKRQLTDIDGDIKDCSANMNRIQAEKRDLQRKMDDETRKLEAQTQGILDEYNRRLQDKKEQIENLELQMSAAEADLARAQSDAETAKRTGNELTGQRDRERHRLEQAEAALSQAAGKQRSEIAVYGGEAVQRVLDEIARTRWEGERPPLGPVGMFVRLREGFEQYGSVLRNVLGGHMRTFVVSDARDLRTLKGLFARNRVNFNVTVAPIDIFDYSAGEPRADVPTMLRALEVSDEWVKRVLINASRVESRGLAPDRISAERMLDAGAARGQVYTADERLVRRYAEGGGMTESLNRMPQNDPRHMMLQSRHGLENFIRQSEADRDDATSKIKALDLQLAGFQKEYRAATAAITAARGKIEGLKRQWNRERAEQTRLQTEANDAAPVSLASFETAFEDAEREEQSTKQQTESILERRVAIVAELKTMAERAEQLRQIHDRVENEAQELKQRIEQAAQNRLQKQKAVEHWVNKKVQEQAIIDDGEKKNELLSKELLQWTEGAKELCPVEVPNPRASKALKRRIETLEKAVQNHEREQGASLDEISRELTDAQKAYDKEVEELNKLNQINAALDHGLSLRRKKWYSFRKQMAIRCKYQFQYHLMNRGFFGKIVFDHDNAKLSLRVQTEDAQSSAAVKAAKGVKDKDPRSLSGGEKSFSTICLLLALWESIGCPIRCLDEFDVFMDAVNRRVSIKMLIDTANASDAKQYVLISPQALSNVEIKETVKVLRMDDPERGVAQ